MGSPISRRRLPGCRWSRRRWPGCPQWCVDGETGFLTPAGDVVRLRCGRRQAARRRRAARQVGGCARRRYGPSARSASLRRGSPNIIAAVPRKARCLTRPRRRPLEPRQAPAGRTGLSSGCATTTPWTLRAALDRLLASDRPAAVPVDARRHPGRDRRLAGGRARPESGWSGSPCMAASHDNHAPAGEKKQELGAAPPDAKRCSTNSRGVSRQRQDSLIGDAGRCRCWCRRGTASMRRWWPAAGGGVRDPVDLRTPAPGAAQGAQQHRRHHRLARQPRRSRSRCAAAPRSWRS